MNICAATCAQWEALLATYSVRIVTPPVFEDEPVTLEDAWHHLRIDTFADDSSPPEIVSGDDFWLTTIGIPAARAWAEAYQGVSLVTQTLELVGREFPAAYFELPAGPVQEIVSVTYIDVDDQEQTVDPADYELNPDVWPNRLQLAFEVAAWPTAQDSLASVKVRYITGYTASGNSPASANIPAATRIGILLMLGHLYENREDTTALNLSVIPNGVRSFLDQDRLRLGFA